MSLSRRTLAAGLIVTCAGAAALSIVVNRNATPLPATSGPTTLLADAAIDAAGAPRARGCALSAPAPAGATLTTRGGRSFHVWGPASYDPAHPYPVVLTFHGWKSNGRDFEKWFRMEEHVGGAAFTVYPDSRTGTWDFGGTSDLEYSADMLETLADAYCIDRGRVLAFGFSYGARFVHHLGCKRPDLVRAVVAGAGGWDKETECSAMPVLVIHRTQDKDQVIAMGKAAALRWAKVDGCSEVTTEPDAYGCFAYRGCTAGAVTFCEDRHFDPKWEWSWNHTVREPYRDLAWRWFMSLP